jgi:hypothetical protein
MDSIFIIILSSSFLLVCVSLFAQPQMAQTQRGDTLLRELERFSLPAGPIADSDIPQIQTVIQQVLAKISESLKPTAQNKADIKPGISGILILEDWLNQQKCVHQASAPWVQKSGEYNDCIFLTYPGQVFFEIFFNTGEKSTLTQMDPGRYRLLVYITAPEVLRFASIIKDNTPLMS